MKHTSLLIIMIMLVTLHSSANANDLTTGALEGNWLFTHILMEGGREIPVNQPTRFTPDGVAIHFDAAGSEKARGTYEISGNRIIYTDAKGVQEWDVISFEENELHVDHRGAQMFFTRQ